MKKTLGDVAPTLADINRYLGSVTSPHARAPPHYHISWSPPLRIIKVNTDRSFTTGFTHGGNGGIFHDDQINPLLHFGKQTDAKSGIHAEILAIKEGFLIASASQWANLAWFIFELDSSNVVL